MRFSEWWEARFKSGIVIPEDLARDAWNAALEEAALEMELKYEGGVVFADAIRLLKEE